MGIAKRLSGMRAEEVRNTYRVRHRPPLPTIVGKEVPQPDRTLQSEPDAYWKRYALFVKIMSATGVNVLRAEYNRPEVTEDDHMRAVSKLLATVGDPYLYIERSSFVERDRMTSITLKFGIMRGRHTKTSKYQRRLEDFPQRLVRALDEVGIQWSGDPAAGRLRLAFA